MRGGDFGFFGNLGASLPLQTKETYAPLSTLLANSKESGPNPVAGRVVRFQHMPGG